VRDGVERRGGVGSGFDIGRLSKISEIIIYRPTIDYLRNIYVYHRPSVCIVIRVRKVERRATVWRWSKWLVCRVLSQNEVFYREAVFGNAMRMGNTDFPL
jgi:hypothetical protein